METLIVLAIVAVAAVYVGRIFYKGVSAKNGCGGCSCCQNADTCPLPPDGDHANGCEARRADD